MREIPATWMRGGTSKCWVFETRGAAGARTSPSTRCCCGCTAAPTTARSTASAAPPPPPARPSSCAARRRPGVDVEYTFAQVGIDEAAVDWGSNCGNCSAVVGLVRHPQRAGWSPPATSPGSSPATPTPARSSSSGCRRRPAPCRASRRPRCPASRSPGYRVRLGFLDPAGRTTGQLLPDRHPRDRPARSDGGVTVTLIDAGRPGGRGRRRRPRPARRRGPPPSSMPARPAGPPRHVRREARCPWAWPTTATRPPAPSPSSRWSRAPVPSDEGTDLTSGCSRWAASIPRSHHRQRRAHARRRRARHGRARPRAHGGGPTTGLRLGTPAGSSPPSSRSTTASPSSAQSAATAASLTVRPAAGPAAAAVALGMTNRIS